jgi:membrane dipeptidase
MRPAAFAALAFLFAIPASAQNGTDVTAEDRQIHERALVFDTHLDIADRFDDGRWDFGERHRYEWDRSQVDLPRMIEGGLDGGFFVVYTTQGENNPAGYAQARNAALVRTAAIHRVIGENRDQMQLALTPDDIVRITAEGKRAMLISMENSWPLGEDLTLLDTFYRLGVRMAGPVHSRDNQLADSTTGEGRWNGLSPLGRQWVAEMNRLGMLIDVSHSSDAAFDQMVELSRVPVIASHSGPRAIFDHKRNLDDNRMRRLARSGGVMFLNSVFLSPYDNSPERNAINERHERWAELNADERRRLLRDRAALDAQRPYTAADFDLLMRSMMHAISVMGVDHVGLGADWDGGGGVIGLEEINLLPRITARLRREGLSEADIGKILGGNLLRVMRQAQAGAARR